MEKPKGLLGEPASYVQFVNIFRYCNPHMTTITFSTVATCRGRSGCKEYRRTLSLDLLAVVMQGHCWTSRSKWRCVILNDFELRNILIEFCIVFLKMQNSRLYKDVLLHYIQTYYISTQWAISASHLKIPQHDMAIYLSTTLRPWSRDFGTAEFSAFGQCGSHLWAGAAKMWSHLL